MKEYDVEITGATPMLVHSDNIEWSDRMDEWRKDPINKKNSKAGDDRTPAWRWVGCLYHDNEHLSIPSENIMKAIMEGAAQVPTGKGQKTFKAQSQSGLLCQSFHWPLLINGSLVKIADINALIDDELTFKDQVEAAESLGFELYVKRAKIGQAKHIRVRPRFSQWSCQGKITVVDSQISRDILGQCLEIAGRYKGLGDWRPGGKTPGPFGMFTAKVL